MRFKSRYTSKYRSKYASAYGETVFIGGEPSDAAPSVDAPSITSPADDATDIGETPTITTSAFAVTGDTDTHASTDWQIASDAAFTTIVVQSDNDATNKVSWTVPAGNLSTSTTYYIRARHTGTTYGDSAYSATVSFTTAAAFTDADAQAIIDEMSPAPSAGRQTLIHNLVKGLKTDGIWTKLDRLWIMAAHSSQPAQLDWKAPATAGRMLTPVSAPSFTADQGYTGDGSTSYLNTNYTPSVDGVNYTQNSACFGVWIRTANPSAVGDYYFGADGTGSQNVWAARNASNLAMNAPQGGAIDTTSGTTGGHTGLLTVNRSASDAVQSYLNGVEETTGTTTSAALVDTDILLFCLTPAFGFNSGQISAAFASASLDATEQSNLYSRLNTYMTGL